MKYIIKACVMLTFFLSINASANAKDYLVTDHGAKGDGKTNDTKAIQRTIDECAAKGGGKVIIPAGNYPTYAISLKSNVELHLEAGAKVEAIADGTKMVALVMLNEIENASITGTGTLFGNGRKFEIGEAAPDRPYIVFVKNSKKVLIENVTLLHSAAWALRIYGADQVTVRGITIYSHANFNNDGIDIDGRNIIISGCNIDCGDDAICLKSEDPKRPTENVVVTNCLVASNCNLIKMGTGSVSGFKNISISNCVLRRASESPFHKWHEKTDHFIDEPITGIGGIALEVVDGGAMDQVSISNISMTGIQTPIFIRLGSRKNATGSLKNVVISNVIARYHSRMTSFIAGVPGFNVENVSLRDIMLTGPGGGTQTDVDRKIPENEKAYPENRVFGWSLPASGLYVRHARNITVDNFQVTHTTADQRPALFLDDVHQFKASGVQLNGQKVKDGTSVKQMNSDNISIE